MDNGKLTAFSKGSGCGCKIPPQTLTKLLSGLPKQHSDKDLLVGLQTNDDAAVYDLHNGQALVTSVDCFTPIVDDAYDFGMIAAANAISDVYAMGGRPVMALSILGWPVDQLPIEQAQAVLAGGLSVCQEAGIPLAGGHSIDSPMPIFGLVVNGLVDRQHLRTNAGAQSGDYLFLTKPIGTGIVAAAHKRGKADAAHVATMTHWMKQLNSIGLEAAEWPGVHAMTDVTGFGLLGHLIEMCNAAGLGASLAYGDVPKLPDEVLQPYLSAFIMPDNTYRNFNSYESAVSTLSAEQMALLCDPQTNGGLLLAVAASDATTVSRRLADLGLPHQAIGRFTDLNGTIVKVS